MLNLACKPKLKILKSKINLSSLGFSKREATTSSGDEIFLLRILYTWVGVFSPDFKLDQDYVATQQVSNKFTILNKENETEVFK